MRRVFKSLICIVTSLVILTFSVVSIPVSAAITPEQEILNYCLVTKKDYFEQGIPYLPSYFQNLNGWTNNKAKWTNFISKSVYPNRMYYTRVLYSGSQVTFYIINYDEITAFSGNVTFKNCIIAQFFGNGFTGDSPSMSLNVEEHINSNNGYVVPDLLATNYSGWVKGYVSFSGDGSTVTDDGKVLYEAMNESKDFGLIKGIKDILSKGGLGSSLMDNSLVDVGINDFDLLGSLVSGQLSLGLSSSLGIGVEVGDDTYNEIVADLSNNTTNSSYWNNIDASTKNNINTMYNNLKNSFDNSVKIYSTNVSSSSTGGDYYYMPSTTNTSANNFSSWVSNGGDITEYFNKYINSFNTTTGDVTTTSGSGGSSSGVGSGSGAYAEANASANAEGGNAEINQGDININIGGDTTSNTGTSRTGSSDFDDVNVSTLEKLLDSCSSFINWVGNVLKELPPEFTMCFTALLTVVIACRIMGR